MICLRLLEHDDTVTPDYGQEFVARLCAQSFARSTRKDNLILGR